MADNTVVRKYSGSDPNLLQQANLNKTLLNDNLAAFTAEDDTIDAAYVAAYALDITEAEETESDELVEDRLSTKTAAVEAAQTAVAKKVKQLRYYVLEAFPTDKEVQHEFGLDEWDAARKTQGGTLKFMTKAHTVATQYQTQLTAAGYNPLRTTALATARQLLEDADNDQEHYRSMRPKLSALRVQEFNEVYNRLTRINSLAQIVFEDDPEMANQFVFDPAGHPAQTDFSGAVVAGETKVITTVAYVADKHIQLANAGTGVVQFMLLQHPPAEEGTVIGLPEGASANPAMSEMNDNAAATKLCVRSGLPDAGASYSVHIGG